MNPRLKPTTIGLIAVSILTSAATQAAVTSINWKEFVGAVNEPVEPYGVESASDWINVQNVLSFTDLTLSGGAPSSIDLTVVSAGGSSGSDTFGGTALNNTPMRSGLQINTAAGSLTLQFSDLNSTFSSYDIIVYLTGFNGANNTTVTTLGGTSYYLKVPAPFTTSLIQSIDTVDDAIDQEGTYVRFSGLSGDTQDIVVTRQGGAVAIGGVQIVGVPEPSTSLLLALVLVPAFFRRSRS